MAVVAVWGFLGEVKIVRAGFFNDLWKIISGSAERSNQDTSAAAIAMPLLGSQTDSSSGMGGPEDRKAEEEAVPIPVTYDSALVAGRNPAGTLPTSESDQISVYTVAEGDTPGGIAQRFGISLNTLLWANDLKNSRSIKVGDTLIILPVSGVKYTVKKGDTLQSIAKKFKPKNVQTEDFDGFMNDIQIYNGLAIDEKLEAGTEIIIPDGEVYSMPSVPSSGKSYTPPRFASLPEFIGYFLRPILGGRKTQGIHGYNGVDLANSCSTQIMASAAGNVIVSKSSGWNGGYGKYVVLSHPNKTQTLYAHMEKIYASVGQHVDQGDTLGLVGSTGRSTGCHVHFEIRGARNPF